MSCIAYLFFFLVHPSVWSLAGATYASLPLFAATPLASKSRSKVARVDMCARDAAATHVFPALLAFTATSRSNIARVEVQLAAPVLPGRFVSPSRVANLPVEG